MNSCYNRKAKTKISCKFKNSAFLPYIHLLKNKLKLSFLNRDII